MDETMKMITLRITDELKQKIRVKVAAINVVRAAAGKRAVTRAEIFREALEEWLNRHDD